MSKETLQLPKTAFSMKANLPNKEPGILEKWEKNLNFWFGTHLHPNSMSNDQVGSGPDPHTIFLEIP